MAQGYRQYAKVYQKSAVNTVDQKKLIVLLYDGAIKYLSFGVNRLNEGDAYEAHVNIIKGKSIVAELLASLDMERGGDIALNLQRLYAYMFNELIEANMNKDTGRIQQVIELLKGLRDAWKDMSTANQVSQPAAEGAVGGGRLPKINVRG